MKHLSTVSRRPGLALIGGGIGGGSNTTIGEQLIILLMTVFFNDWENFGTVIQNLQKYYQKTPD